MLPSPTAIRLYPWKSNRSCTEYAAAPIQIRDLSKPTVRMSCQRMPRVSAMMTLKARPTIINDRPYSTPLAVTLRLRTCSMVSWYAVMGPDSSLGNMAAKAPSSRKLLGGSSARRYTSMAAVSKVKV